MEVSSARPVYQLAALYLFAIFYAVSGSYQAFVTCKRSEQKKEGPFKSYEKKKRQEC